MAAAEITEQALHEIATIWQTESSETVWLKSGFDWTPGSHLVRVRVDDEGGQSAGRIRLSVETELLNDIPVEKQAFRNLVGATSLFITSSYSLVYPPADVWEKFGGGAPAPLTMFSSAYISEELLGWLPAFFAQLAVMQPIDAEMRSAMLPKILGAGEPAFAAGTKKQTYDDILEVAGTVYAPAGEQPSRWIGSSEFADFAENYGRSDSCFGNGDATGLSFEVPFGSNSALIRLQTDQRHPQLKNGLLITVQLPHWANSAEIDELAANLNFAEARGWTDFPQIGCWHSHARGDGQSVSAHSSFIPNALYRPGLVFNLAAWSASRARWARRQYWPDLEDAPMWKILEARYGKLEPLFGVTDKGA
jgi:hypothetical protein